jgi:hypothetical protein
MLIRKSVFVGVCVSSSWGKPFWRRVLPQTPFLNLLMTFQQREAKLPSLKSVREFRKRV